MRGAKALAAEPRPDTTAGATEEATDESTPGNAEETAADPATASGRAMFAVSDFSRLAVGCWGVVLPQHPCQNPVFDTG